jgi:hypothetical protein
MTPVVGKKIIVIIWNDVELNALSNEDKLNFQGFQKTSLFWSNIEPLWIHLEYTKGCKRPI